MEILGVDFSGAKSDSNTWMAEGFLDGQELTLCACRPVTRAELTERLTGAASNAIAALDFPFSVPLSFASYWMLAAKSMTDLWKAASSMELARFIEMRDAFVPFHGETKRICDALYPECYSCLHKTNPNMLPMTFYGMRMLSCLWDAGCDVPPLKPQGRGGPRMLEVMPGAVLRALGLPYKGYKNGMKALELRGRILTEISGHVLKASVKNPVRPELVEGHDCQSRLDGKGLQGNVSCYGIVLRQAQDERDFYPQALGLPLHLSGLADFSELCLTSHDCLDAIVAFIGAGLWAAAPSSFRLPESEGLNDNDPAIQIEGWLYAPVHLMNLNK